MSRYFDALVIVSLSRAVSLLTRIGHESLKRLACEYISIQNPVMIKKVSNKVIIIAITRGILFRTKKSTMGRSTMAIMIAKTSGTIIFFAMYNIVIKANEPTRKIVAFA
jgi:hypothetical protein